MRRLFSILILIVFSPFLVALIYEAGVFTLIYLARSGKGWLFLGAGVYLVIYLVVPRRHFNFIQIFEHELGHAFMALLCGKGLRHLSVDLHRGQVKYQGTPNVFITLAPYTLPVFTVPFLLMKPFLTPLVYDAADFFIGITLAFFYVRLKRDFYPKQPDIKETGLFRALIFVIVGNTILAVVILCALAEELRFTDYFNNVLIHAVQIYEYVQGVGIKR